MQTRRSWTKLVTSAVAAAWLGVAFAAAPAAAADKITVFAAASMKNALDNADSAWMAYVSKKNLTKSGPEVQLLGNQIVLVAAKDKAKPVEIKEGLDLAA